MAKESNVTCEKCKPTNADKWRYTLITTVIFLIVVNPVTYTFVQSILGRFVRISKGGCPTYTGILIHAVVFTLALRYVMGV